MLKRSLVVTLALALHLLSACGGTEIGESCDEAGSTDECVEGAVCATNQKDYENACRQVCKVQADCPADHTCTMFSSPLKSCQPD